MKLWQNERPGRYCLQLISGTCPFRFRWSIILKNASCETSNYRTVQNSLAFLIALDDWTPPASLFLSSDYRFDSEHHCAASFLFHNATVRFAAISSFISAVDGVHFFWKLFSKGWPMQKRWNFAEIESLTRGIRLPTIDFQGMRSSAAFARILATIWWRLFIRAVTKLFLYKLENCSMKIEIQQKLRKYVL